MTRITDRKVLYFIAGQVPTANELADIAKIEGNIGIRNSLINATYTTRLESADYVAAYDYANIPSVYAAAYPLARRDDGGANVSVYRGSMQGSKIAVQGFSNAAGKIARCNRARKYQNFPFRFYRIVIPVFQPASVPIVDTLFAAIMRFQHGLEYPFVNALTGIPSRKVTTFNKGNNFIQFDPATWDASYGYIISDKMDLGFYLPAGQFYGEWLTTELSAAGTNVLPYTQNSSNFFQRYTGAADSATSLITQFGGATNFAIDSTSISDVGNSQGGISNLYMPTMILMAVPPETKMGASIGDSIDYSVGEGAAGSSTGGDSQGSALGNAGWIDRFIFEKAKLGAINLGRGSDRLAYLRTSANWKYRRQLLQLANPRFIIQENSINDTTSGPAYVSWAASTAFAQYDVIIAGGAHAYLVMQAGTSGSVSPTATGVVSDGTAVLTYLGESTSTPMRGAYALVGRVAAVTAQLKLACPTAKIFQTLTTPYANSTDAFLTVENQTPQTGFGSLAAIREIFNGFIQLPAIMTLLQIDGILDPTPAIENAPNTSIFKIRAGLANGFTPDGIHPNSFGAAAIVDVIPEHALD